MNDNADRYNTRLILCGCVLCALSVIFVLFGVEPFGIVPLFYLYLLHLVGLTHFLVWIAAVNNGVFENLGVASAFSTSMTMSAISVIILQAILGDDWSLLMLIVMLLPAETATAIAVSIRLVIWKQQHDAKD